MGVIKGLELGRYPGWSNVITSILLSEIRWQRSEDATLLALKTEERTMRQGRNTGGL